MAIVKTLDFISDTEGFLNILHMQFLTPPAAGVLQNDYADDLRKGTRVACSVTSDPDINLLGRLQRLDLIAALGELSERTPRVLQRGISMANLDFVASGTGNFAVPDNDCSRPHSVFHVGAGRHQHNLFTAAFGRSGFYLQPDTFHKTRIILADRPHDYILAHKNRRNGCLVARIVTQLQVFFTTISLCSCHRLMVGVDFLLEQQWVR